VTWTAHLCTQVGGLKLDCSLYGANRPVALVGPNGAGKSTVLRTLAGLHPATGGAIQIGEQILFDSGKQVSLAPEQRHVGYVPQGGALFSHMTVLENVAYGLRHRMPTPDRRQRAEAVLNELGVAQLAAQRASTLSGGEQQKVALARALAPQPQWLLLDEPLAGLDAKARRALRRWLGHKLRDWQLPALVVTHDALDVQALDAQVFVLERGIVTQAGRLEDLKAAPLSAYVAEFCGLPEPSAGADGQAVDETVR